MATFRERENGTFEFVVRRKRLLPKPIYLTFTSREAGEEYCARLEQLLDAGVVPDEFKQEFRSATTMAKLIRGYVSGHTPKQDDVAKLNIITLKYGSTLLTSVTFAWAEEFIAWLKHEKRLAPSSILKYAGALSRCLNWGVNKGLAHDNPFVRLPRGYARYSEDDARIAGIKREDSFRDIRLPEGAEDKILKVITSKNTDVEAHRVLFMLALETAMRLREMATLTTGQVDLDNRTVFLEKTKNGDKRQVPLTSVARDLLREHVKELDSEFLFPWWNGEPGTLPKVSSRVSKSFARIFELAGVPDYRFHDLRHEATSRLFERTRLTDTEIAKITGHKDPRVLMRYANLRGSSLADKLW